MTIGKARAIFEDICRNDIEPEEKMLAIQTICDMETHNSIKKGDIIDALRWLVDLLVRSVRTIANMAKAPLMENAANGRKQQIHKPDETLHRDGQQEAVQAAREDIL